MIVIYKETYDMNCKHLDNPYLELKQPQYS